MPKPKVADTRYGMEVCTKCSLRFYSLLKYCPTCGAIGCCKRAELRHDIEKLIRDENDRGDGLLDILAKDREAYIRQITDRILDIVEGNR